VYNYFRFDVKKEIPVRRSSHEIRNVVSIAAVPLRVRNGGRLRSEDY
jgi:hypothetical protein